MFKARSLSALDIQSSTGTCLLIILWRNHSSSVGLFGFSNSHHRIIQLMSHSFWSVVQVSDIQFSLLGRPRVCGQVNFVEIHNAFALTRSSNLSSMF